MSTSRLVADSLWQCLCPSFTSHTLANSRAILGRRRRPELVKCLGSTSRSGQRASSQARRDAQVKHYPALGFYNPLGDVPNAETRSQVPTFASFGNHAQRKKPKFEASTAIRTPRQKREQTFQDEPIPRLYEMARAAAGLGKTQDVCKIVKHLVVERREHPSLRLYSILILANVNPLEGAAWRVAALLEEMAKEGLTMDVGICHDVLKVLSVHLDYLLRADILAYMRQRWLVLTDEGHHYIAAGLFREGQLELALEQLKLMKTDGLKIRPWLADLATYALSDSGEHHDALQVIKDQVTAGDLNISKSVYSHVLDNASSDFHHEATSYCWRSQVSPGYLNPSAGLCLNVLTTAARAGDAPLATEVFHILGKRGTVFQPIHYEQLLCTYMSTSPPDLRAALTVLVIMAQVKLEPAPTSTRPLLEYLRGNPDACLEAVEILTSLNHTGRLVPVAALNVVIEAHVQNRNLEQALIIYKAMHTFERLSATEPHRPLATVETFNHLLRGTYRASTIAAHETALFLASEMLALGIKPNALSYDRLIIVCLSANRFDHAFRYFDEMDGLGFKPRQHTGYILAKDLASSGDDRCWDVLQRMQDHGPINTRWRVEIETAWIKWGTEADNSAVKAGIAEAGDHVNRSV